MHTLSLNLNINSQMVRTRTHRVYHPSLKIVQITTIISIIIFISIYLSQINHVAVNLYEISQLESKIKKLSFANQQLELSLANSGQQTDLAQLAQKFNFEKINKIYYIREDGNRIVER